MELALNYVADQTAKQEGGMFDLAEVPYQTYGPSCNGLAEGKNASVGVEGWTQLPSNNYKAMMNAVAKVGHSLCHLDCLPEYTCQDSLLTLL